MVNVMLRNTLDVEVKVTEGNYGVYTEMATLSAREGTYVIEVDLNDTYREYVMYVLPDGMQVNPVVTTDDLVDYEKIIIKKEQGVVVWQGTRRGSANNGSATKNPLYIYQSDSFIHVEKNVHSFKRTKVLKRSL